MRAKCSHCGAVSELPAKAVGSVVECLPCGKWFMVDAPAPTPRIERPEPRHEDAATGEPVLVKDLPPINWHKIVLNAFLSGAMLGIGCMLFSAGIVAPELAGTYIRFWFMFAAVMCVGASTQWR